MLSQSELRQIPALPQFVDAQIFVDLYYADEGGPEAALKRSCVEATAVVRDGARIVFLSDRYPPEKVAARR